MHFILFFVYSATIQSVKLSLHLPSLGSCITGSDLRMIVCTILGLGTELHPCSRKPRPTEHVTAKRFLSFAWLECVLNVRQHRRGFFLIIGVRWDGRGRMSYSGGRCQASRTPPVAIPTCASFQTHSNSTSNPTLATTRPGNLRCKSRNGCSSIRDNTTLIVEIMIRR
jgi:hypothetical protein